MQRVVARRALRHERAPEEHVQLGHRMWPRLGSQSAEVLIRFMKIRGLEFALECESRVKAVHETRDTRIERDSRGRALRSSFFAGMFRNLCAHILKHNKRARKNAHRDGLDAKLSFYSCTVTLHARAPWPCVPSSRLRCRRA